MAAATANVIFEGSASAESAGASPDNTGAHQNAAAVIWRRYGVDISAHIPRDVRSLDLDAFDHVIAIGTSAYRTLLGIPNIESRLRCWSISDPYSRPAEVYEQCATELEQRVRSLREGL
jgi:protein-tyrosine-phosphatase